MTSPARVRANRLNALASTGPRTDAGKHRSSLNALRLGLFARALVVPSLCEDAEEAAAFCRVVVADLAPAGTVELELAQRAAGLMWRLRRVVRCEGAVMTAAAGKLPPHPDEVAPISAHPYYLPVPADAPTDYRLGRLRDVLRGEPNGLASAKSELAVLDETRNPDDPIYLGAASRVLGAGAEVLGWPPDPAPWPSLLTDLGFGRVSLTDVKWTVGGIHKVLAAAAEQGKRDVGEFLEAVRTRLHRAIADTERWFEERRAEEVKLAAQLLRQRAETAAAKVYAAEAVVQSVARAEAHLMAQLDKTLKLLAERKAARRAEENCLPLGFVLPCGEG